jgi:hypothetical protein
MIKKKWKIETEVNLQYNFIPFEGKFIKHEKKHRNLNAIANLPRVCFSFRFKIPFGPLRLK